MSSTSTDDEQVHETNLSLPRAPKFKRRKVAIFFAYCGVGYQGMQKNPGAKTIEGDLEEALYLSGAVPEADRGQSKRFDFARSARTDKGVSAVGQVVSGRFYVDPPGLVNRLNSDLPPQIRIFGYKEATESFNAKKFCDRRRYVYLIPVFALDPSCHRDRESVWASVGSGKELAKCLECSERGRKVFGVMGKRPRPFGSGISSTTTSAHNNSLKIVNGKNGSTESPQIVGIESCKDVLVDSYYQSNNGTASIKEKTAITSSELGNSETGRMLQNGARDIHNIGEDKLEKSGFCYGEAERERFTGILKRYEGRHNFHNFTTRMKPDDPAANRYIISIDADTTVTIDGIEFVKCEIVGQSFMLHQIRKMIGVAVAVMRNCTSASLITTAFQANVNINVPMAPEVGLYLQECFFSSYNQQQKDGCYKELSMEDYAEEAEEFKMKHIYPHIASAEHKDGSVALWLHSLNYRNYPDLRTADMAL